MEPTLRDGDWLRRVPRTGELVVAPDPREPRRLLVKRVAGVDAAGVRLAGDRADASTDSREFGPVAPSSLLGRPLFRYAPLARFGRVR
jgi:nickel-type superoxide dismutase maturation protease